MLIFERNIGPPRIIRDITGLYNRHWIEIDDETGATANRASMVNGTAFFWSVGVDLSTYQDGLHRVTLHDSGGKTAVGYISATAPAGESLGSEQIDDPSCATDTFTAQTNWSFDGVNGEYDAAGANSAQAIFQAHGFTQGMLGKIVYTVKNYSAGTVISRLGDNIGSKYGTPHTSDGTFTDYTNWFDGGGVNIAFFGTTGQEFTGSIDDVSLKQVTDPPSTGARIVSSIYGVTQNWASIDSGFNANTISTFEVEAFQ